MSLKFLQETNQDILGKLKTDLKFVDSRIDLDQLNEMTVRGLDNVLGVLQANTDTMKTGRYGSWLSNPDFTRNMMLVEAVESMIALKKDDMKFERLIPGETYYSGVARFGDLLEGHKAIFAGTKFTGWMPFRESTAVVKAMQLLRHGSEDDFREIYVGLADGCVDSLETISMDHITESSQEALAEIEQYCDERWEGPWPWEIEAPEKLKYMIESREEKHMKTLKEMQLGMARMLREFDEGSMNQFEMVSASQEMMKRVDNMISDLGKLSSSGIEVMAQAKATGDEHLVQPMQNALGEPLNTAVSSLTDLKAALSNAMSDVTSGGATAPAGDDLGSPADMMGAEPTDPVSADPLDDIDISAGDGERPVKDM